MIKQSKNQIKTRYSLIIYSSRDRFESEHLTKNFVTREQETPPQAPIGFQKAATSSGSIVISWENPRGQPSPDKWQIEYGEVSNWNGGGRITVEVDGKRESNQFSNLRLRVHAVTVKT